MSFYIFRLLSALVVASVCSCSTASSSAVSAPDMPIPETGAVETLSTAKGEKIAVFAGGCFWGVEAVFESVKGVKDVK